MKQFASATKMAATASLLVVATGKKNAHAAADTVADAAERGSGGCVNRHHKNLECLPAHRVTSSCRPELCLSKPSSMTFVYTGGDCKHSYHPQKNTHFFCLDNDPNNGPPTELGTESYIKVIGGTDMGAEDDGGHHERSTVYHSDSVRVGEMFTLFDNGYEFGDSLVMTIYDPEMNLLQEIIYQVTCDGNIFLCDRFGAVELCGFINDDQGEVHSCPPGVVSDIL